MLSVEKLHWNINRLDRLLSEVVRVVASFWLVFIDLVACFTTNVATHFQPRRRKSEREEKKKDLARSFTLELIEL